MPGNIFQDKGIRIVKTRFQKVTLFTICDNDIKQTKTVL